MLNQNQIESYTTICCSSKFSSPFVSDVSPGYDLRVLRRLGVPAGYAGTRWSGHHFHCSHLHAAGEGGAARGPEQLLQHSIRQEPREAPT